MLKSRENCLLTPHLGKGGISCDFYEDFKLFFHVSNDCRGFY